MNATLITVERAMVDAAGLHGRPWYRHLIYAPKFTYAPEVLPGVSEALEANDRDRLAQETARLAAALIRAARALE
jgi:N-acetylated-alpha-linked acidic dipeptidase